MGKRFTVRVLAADGSTIKAGGFQWKDSAIADARQWAKNAERNGMLGVYVFAPEGGRAIWHWQRFGSPSEMPA